MFLTCYQFVMEVKLVGLQKLKFQLLEKKYYFFFLYLRIIYSENLSILEDYEE